MDFGRVGVAQRGDDVANFRAVLRTEQAQVRLHLVFQHIALVRNRLNLLHIQLVLHLRRDLRKQRDLIRRAQPDQRVLQRLAHLQARLAARSPSHAGQPHRKPRGVRQPLVYQRFVRDGEVIQMDAFFLLPVGQVAVHLLRQERHHRRDQLYQRHQAVVERGVCAVLVGVRVLGEDARLPEAPTAAAHIPVRQVLDEALDIARRSVRVEVLECVGYFLDELVQFGQNPAVEFGALRHGRRRCRGVVAVDVRISNEERIHIPERDDEATAHLVRGAEAEVDVQRRVLAQKHPAHRVNAHALGGVLEPYRVALALVHLLAPVVAHQRVAEDRLERSGALQNRAHREQRVEPVAELPGEALGNPVGGEPLAPVVLVVAVLDGGERDNARVQPRVAHILDAAHRHIALVAADFHRIDPGAVRRVALELVPALDGALLQFGLAADDIEPVAVAALVDGQREAVVSLLGNHPVVHVPQPVEFARVAELRNPADVVHHFHNLVAQAVRLLVGGQLLARLLVLLAHADEPLIHQPEDQLRVAAPADRVAVRVAFEIVEDRFRLQAVVDGVVRVIDVLPGEPVESVNEVAVLVERRDGGDAVLAAKLEVFLTRAGSDMHDARALGLADLFPRDHAMLHALLRGKLGERCPIARAHQLTRRHIAQHLVLALQNRFAFLYQIQNLAVLPHLDVCLLGMHGGGGVGGERPGRGRPDQQGFPISLPPF